LELSATISRVQLLKGWLDAEKRAEAAERALVSTVKQMQDLLAQAPPSFGEMVAQQGDQREQCDVGQIPTGECDVQRVFSLSDAARLLGMQPLQLIDLLKTWQWIYQDGPTHKWRVFPPTVEAGWLAPKGIQGQIFVTSEGMEEIKRIIAGEKGKEEGEKGGEA